MKKLILFILVLGVLINVNTVMAGFCYEDWDGKSITSGDYLIYELCDGDSLANFTSVGNVGVNGSVCQINGSNSWSNYMKSKQGLLPNVTDPFNYTVEMMWKPSGSGGTSQTSLLSYGAISSGIGYWDKGQASTDIGSYGWETAFQAWANAYTPVENNWYNISWHITNSTYASLYNFSDLLSSKAKVGGSAEKVERGWFTTGTYPTGYRSEFNYILVYNGTDCPLIPRDSMSITLRDGFNLSSVDATITLSNTTYSNVSNSSEGSFTYYVSDGVYNITIALNNYSDVVLLNWNSTLDVLENLTYYKARFQEIAKIRTKVGNTTINNINFSFYNLNTSETEILSNTTNGNITTLLSWNQTYKVTIDPAGYEIKYVIINTSNENDFTLNNIIYFYTMNSFDFEFRDEITKSLLNDRNITIELISDVFSNNYTTSNGTLFVDLLTPSLYNIRYSSNNYNERFYYAYLTDRTYNNLSLYLLSTGANVTATVLDNNNRPLEDAYIKVLRYDLATNSYLIREIGKTNFEGETKLNLQLNAEFYKFIIEYPFGTVEKVTSPTYIYETTLTFQITLGEAVGEDFFNSQGVNYALTFNNNTNNMRFTYSDSGSSVSQGCLEIYRNKLKESVLYNTTCVSDSSASIILGITNTTGGTFEAKGFVYLGSTKYYLTSLSHTFDESRFAGNLGMLLIIFLTIVFAFIGAWSLSVALILTPLPLFFGIIMNLIDFSIQIAIGLEIVCIIVAIVISRKNA